MKRLASLLTLLLAAGLAGGAHAQSFNVDYGAAAGTPSDAFGAAAGQPGHWNSITGLEGEPVALLDVNGAATGVTIVPSLPFGQAWSNSPSTDGDVEALMDDYFDLHSVPATFEIRGLSAGGYRIYVYSWAPDDDRFRTTIGIDGRRVEMIGGPWPGGFQEGVTHVVLHTGVGPGQALPIYVFGLPKGTLNGIQIERLAEER